MVIVTIDIYKSLTIGSFKTRKDEGTLTYGGSMTTGGCHPCWPIFFKAGILDNENHNDEDEDNDDEVMMMIIIIFITPRQQFSECTLRVFTTGSDKLNNSMSMFEMFSKTIEARMESQKMEKLLAEFRISASNVMVVPNVSRHAEAPMV